MIQIRAQPWTETTLASLLDRAATRRPDHPAVEDELGRSLTYTRSWPEPPTASPPVWHAGASAEATGSACSCPKGSRPSPAIHGILRAGAAYVPVDPTAPVTRGAGIFASGGVKAVVVAAELAAELHQAWPGPGPCRG